MKGKRVNGMVGRKESLIPIYFSHCMEKCKMRHHLHHQAVLLAARSVLC